MGQDQSISARNPIPPHQTDDGVKLVTGAGSEVASSSEHGPVRELLDKSSALPLPHQILPPPAVRDDISSALQGAQVIQDLRAALEGLLMGTDARQPSHLPKETEVEVRNATNGHEPERERSNDGQNGAPASPLVDGLKQEASSIDDLALNLHIDTQADQQKWARLGIDQEAIKAVIDECTGGRPAAEALERQKRLFDRLLSTKERSIRLRDIMSRHQEDAKRTTLALERLDRLHVALSDVQETLESAVATANILGASHFAHDDEMCSFKNFLKYNPPRDS